MPWWPLPRWGQIQDGPFSKTVWGVSDQNFLVILSRMAVEMGWRRESKEERSTSASYAVVCKSYVKPASTGEVHPPLSTPCTLYADHGGVYKWCAQFVPNRRCRLCFPAERYQEERINAQISNSGAHEAHTVIPLQILFTDLTYINHIRLERKVRLWSHPEHVCTTSKKEVAVALLTLTSGFVDSKRLFWRFL